METTSTETNKKVARQVFETFEKGDYSQFDKIADKKFKLHFPGMPAELNYDDAIKLNTEYHDAFPDAKVTVETQIAEGDYVLSRLTYNGTNKGSFQGMPASNKKAKVTGMALQKFANGKLVEEWDEFDMFGMLQQIGAVPEMANHNHK